MSWSPRDYIRDVEPIGSNRYPAFVDYADGRGALESIEVPVYPAKDVERGRRLRAARVGEPPSAHITLAQAAKLFGLTPSQVSGLEAGRCEPVAPFDEAFIFRSYTDLRRQL